MREDCSQFTLKTGETTHVAPTKGLYQLIPVTAMLFTPLGCMDPPPLVPPFRTNNSTGSDVMKIKVS